MNVLARGVRIESYGCGRSIYGDKEALRVLLEALAKAADVHSLECHIIDTDNGVGATLLAKEGICSVLTSTKDRYLFIESLFTGIQEEKLGHMLKVFKEQVQCQTMTHELIARGVRLGEGDPGACILSEREW